MMTIVYALIVFGMCLSSFVFGVYLACITLGSVYRKKIQQFADSVGEVTKEEKHLLKFMFGDNIDWEKRP